MKIGYNIMNPTVVEYARMEKDMYDAEKKFLKKGYEKPVNVINLIKEIYNDQYEREARTEAPGFYELSDIKELRIDVLKTLTLTKLYNKLTETFDQDANAQVSFSFKNGKPDEETSEFFNLRDESGEYANITRTEGFRLPRSYCSRGTPKEAVFSIFSDREELIFGDKVENSNNSIEASENPEA